MHVQVNTSNGIDNKETLERWATDYLNEHLARFDQDVTAIEVQLTDENQGGKKGADDKRCMLEARMNGRTPVAVTHHAENQDLAFRGAADKLVRVLEHTFGKLDRQDHRSRETIRRNPDVVAEVLPGSEPR
jgi:ribosome-associated translation inhibitor RaiA